MPNFTTEDLLVYLYNEMPPQQSAELEQALTNDWALREKFGVLKEAHKKLNQVRLTSPGEKTINRILQYASHTTHIVN